MIAFHFIIQEQLISPSFCKILGWAILILSFAKFIMGDILADTAILGNASKKALLCSCYKHTNNHDVPNFSSDLLVDINQTPLILLSEYIFNSHYMFWRSGPGHILLHTVTTQSQSMSTAGLGGCWKKKTLSDRRICQHTTILEGQSSDLDCICHCNVFSTINWLLLFLKMDLDVM